MREHNNMQAVIIAGGKGTRLRPLTYTCPKPLIPLVNKPALQYQIELLRKHNIKDIILCLNYKSDEIEEYFGGGKELGVKIQYAIEDKPLGTAGAVKNAEILLSEEPIIVFNGDILTDVDLSKIIEFHKNKGAVVTLTLTYVDDPTLYGLIVTDNNNRVIQFLEKPSWDQVVANTINAGIYILEQDILRYIPKNREYSIEREVFPLLLDADIPVYGYPASCYWIDVGTPKKYKTASFDVLEGRVQVEISGNRAYGGIWMAEEVEVHPTTSISGFVYLGNNVKIGRSCIIQGPVIIDDTCNILEDVRISHSIIGANSTIFEKAQVQNCIIGRNCKVKSAAIVGPGNVIGDGSIIEHGIGRI